VWADANVDLPRLESQVAELAVDDFGKLAHELIERGHHVDPSELDALYVHVQLDDEVRRALTKGPRAWQEAPRRA
jgi:hypothetical protein